MSRTRVTFKNRQEWLAGRTQGIGASEVPTILGLNPWETPLQLWRRKKGIDPPKPENFAMKAGHYLEDAVSRFYADETGVQIIQASKDDFMFINDEKPFLRVSPDRTYWRPGVVHNEANKSILECKTTQMEIDPEDLPKHWFCQLQMNLGVAELEQGALAWLTMGRDFGHREFTFDGEFYDWMVEEVEKFWTDNIVGNVEPDPVNVEDLILRNPRHLPGKLVEADADIIEACKQLKKIKEELSDLDSRKKELEDKIKMSMGDAEALTAPGGTPAKPLILATWKAAKDGQKFNEKEFAANEPEMYKSYLYDVPGSRRFLLK